MEYPAHRTKIFQNFIFYTLSKTVNRSRAYSKKLKITIEDDIKCIIISRSVIQYGWLFQLKIYIKITNNKHEDGEEAIEKESIFKNCSYLYNIYCGFVYFTCFLLLMPNHNLCMYILAKIFNWIMAKYMIIFNSLGFCYRRSYYYVFIILY